MFVLIFVAEKKKKENSRLTIADKVKQSMQDSQKSDEEPPSANTTSQAYNADDEHRTPLPGSNVRGTKRKAQAVWDVPKKKHTRRSSYTTRSSTQKNNISISIDDDDDEDDEISMKRPQRRVVSHVSDEGSNASE
jgi:hypothetical protein